MINSICIKNEKDVLLAPELFYNVKPIVLTTISDSEDESYHASINLEKNEDHFQIVVITNDNRLEMERQENETWYDVYMRAWKHIRSANQMNITWSHNIARRNDADVIAMTECMKTAIAMADFKRSFVGHDGITHDFTNDPELIKILDDIAMQMYAPAFAKALSESGFSNKRKN